MPTSFINDLVLYSFLQTKFNFLSVAVFLMLKHPWTTVCLFFPLG